MSTEQTLGAPDSRGVSVLPDMIEGAWRLKTYLISAHEDSSSSDLIAAAYRLAKDALPMPAQGDERHGVGFAIIHDGKLGRWAMYFWWSHNVWFHQKLYHSPLDSDLALRAVSGDLIACIYELIVIEWERRAWTNHALQEQDIDAYLTARMPAQDTIFSVPVHDPLDSQ